MCKRRPVHCFVKMHAVIFDFFFFLVYFCCVYQYNWTNTSSAIRQKGESQKGVTRKVFLMFSRGIEMEVFEIFEGYRERLVALNGLMINSITRSLNVFSWNIHLTNISFFSKTIRIADVRNDTAIQL